MSEWRSFLVAALLVVAVCWAPAHGAGLSACQADAKEQLSPACREAIAGASAGEVIALVDAWVAARHYAEALRVLQDARQRRPSDARLRLREHEIQSLAD